MMKNTFCPVVPCPIVPAVPLRYDVYTDPHVHIFIEKCIDAPKNFANTKCLTLCEVRDCQINSDFY